jgi:hypothetical protein
MSQQTDIEIIKVEAKEVAISTNKTIYVCAYWNTNGILCFSIPSESKEMQENYALKMSKYSEHTFIYKFDIDIPNFKNK